MLASRSVAPIRVSWYDNARWLAGSLVVAVHFASGHIVGGTIGSRGTAMDWLHVASYPMRLPLFALLVGFFTPLNPTTRDQRNLIRTVVIPLAVVTAGHVALTQIYTGTNEWTPIKAEWTLWFLYGVVIWRASAGFLWRVRHPLLLAVVLSLLAGMYQEMAPWHLQYIISLSPYFVLGLMLRNQGNFLERRSPYRTKVAIGVVAAWVVGVTVLWYFALLDRYTIAMVSAYPGEGTPDMLAAMGWRLLVLATVIPTMLAVLHLVPRRRIRFISYIGAGGFTIYLLHSLVLRFIRYNFAIYGDRSIPGQFLLVLAGFVLAAILGSKPVRWLTDPILRPKLRWLFKPDESDATPPRPIGGAGPRC